MTKSVDFRAPFVVLVLGSATHRQVVRSLRLRNADRVVTRYFLVWMCLRPKQKSYLQSRNWILTATS